MIQNEKRKSVSKLSKKDRSICLTLIAAASLVYLCLLFVFEDFFSLLSRPPLQEERVYFLSLPALAAASFVIYLLTSAAMYYGALKLESIRLTESSFWISFLLFAALYFFADLPFGSRQMILAGVCFVGLQNTVYWHFIWKRKQP